MYGTDPYSINVNDQISSLSLLLAGYYLRNELSFKPHKRYWGTFIISIEPG